MKKTIVFCLIFSVLAANAFAQLSFSGSMYAGVQLEIPFVEGEDVMVNTLHREEGAPTFNFTATASRPGFGARLNTTFQYAETDPLTLNGIYGWANFLDNSLRFTVGRINDAVWVGNLDSNSVIEFDVITGFRLDYTTPIPGLSVGAAFPAADHDVELFAKKVMLGAMFMHPMFNATLAYDMGNNTRALFTFNYFGIPNLELGIQAFGRNLSSWDCPQHSGSLELTQRVSYRVIRPLTVSMLFGQVFSGVPDRDILLSFSPRAQYRINPAITAFLDIEITTPDYFSSPDTMTTRVRPSVEFSLGGPAVFYAQYELFMGHFESQSFHRFSIGIDIRAF